jgi:hypothetical protein
VCHCDECDPDDLALLQRWYQHQYQEQAPTSKPLPWYNPDTDPDAEDQLPLVYQPCQR